MEGKIIKGVAATGPAADPKLVKKEAYGAVLDAVTILDTAREQARAILRDADARSQSTLEEARRQGEAEGLARYLEAVAKTKRALDEFYASAEPELVKLAAAVARKIVGEELQGSPETIVRIVREALAAGRQARQVGIKVHPSHAAQLRRSIADLGLGPSCEVHVAASEGVAPGGCIIESEYGIIDAQLETQLRVIERSLLGGAQ